MRSYFFYLISLFPSHHPSKTYQMGHLETTEAWLMLYSPPLFTQLHLIPSPVARQLIRGSCLSLLLDAAAALHCCSGTCLPGPFWLWDSVG